jgi:hypothetical protein
VGTWRADSIEPARDLRLRRGNIGQLGDSINDLVYRLDIVANYNRDDIRTAEESVRV